MILGDFLKALGQVGDPRFRRVLGLGIGLTLALLFAVYAILATVLNIFLPDTITLPLIGAVTWVDDLLSWASILLMIALSVFLMVPVASAFTGLFLDQVADAVEDRHYPTLPAARAVPLLEGLRDAVGFLGIIVAANLVALVAYVFVTPAAPFIFWALNGYLLGREYFQLVAMRRVGRAEAKAAFRRHAGSVWLAGGLMAVPLTVPIVNLLVPVLGVATFTHLYHRLERG
ncbi:MAG: EI24 domain-containing protein [Paracoccaceae bacterium]